MVRFSVIITEMTGVKQNRVLYWKAVMIVGIDEFAGSSPILETK